MCDLCFPAFNQSAAREVTINCFIPCSKTIRRVMQLIITRKFTPRNGKLSTIQTQMNSMLYLRTLAAVNDLFHFEKMIHPCPLLPDCLIRELCTYWEIKARHFAAAAVIPYLVKFNYIMVLYKQTAKIELVLALCTLTLEIFSLNWI